MTGTGISWKRDADYSIRYGCNIESREPIEVAPLVLTYGIKRGLRSRRKSSARPEAPLMTLPPMSIISITRSGLDGQISTQKEMVRDLGYRGMAVGLALDQIHDTGECKSSLRNGTSNVYVAEDKHPQRHIAFTIEDPSAFWASASIDERVSMRAMADLVLMLANPTEASIQQIQTNIDETTRTA